MITFEKYFGFVRIDLKWYYIGKVVDLEDCFQELDRRYSAFMKTEDSFFWLEEEGELHDEDGDQKIGYGYFDGAEVVTAEQFAKVTGRVLFGHEGIEVVPAEDLEEWHLDLMDESKVATSHDVVMAAIASGNFEWIFVNNKGGEGELLDFFSDGEVAAERKASALLKMNFYSSVGFDGFDLLDFGLDLRNCEIDEDYLITRGLGWLLACAERLTAQDLPEIKNENELLPYITGEVLSISRFELRMIFEAEADKLGFDYESQEEEGFSLLAEDLTNAEQYLVNFKTRAEVVALAHEFIQENIANSSNE